MNKEKTCTYCIKNFLHKKGHLFGSYCSSSCSQKAREDIKNPWVEKKCGNEGCENIFQVRKNNILKRYCSLNSCTNVARKNADIKYSIKKNLLKAEIKNEFIDNVSEKQIIDYSDSPTGKAFIGFAKEPLMKNENGIGYKGVKIQTDNRELIQCYECGTWLTKITTKHLNRCSDLNTVNEYKEKYGFNKNTGLVSDSLSNWHAAHIQHNKAMVENYKRAYLARKKIKKRSGRPTNTMETMNLNGTCPEQLKDRLISYIKRFKRIPHSTGGGRDGFPVNTYKKRFGSINNALKEYGLPTRIRVGYNTEYHFADGSIYLVGQNGMGYEDLYRIMQKKCSVLN